MDDQTDAQRTGRREKKGMVMDTIATTDTKNDTNTNQAPTAPAVGALTATPALIAGESFESAYRRLNEELAAMNSEDLLQVNLDIPSAVTTTLGVLPQVRVLRDQIAQQLPAFDLKQFDKLEDYAFALSYAHSHYLTALEPADDLAKLSEDGLALRGLLVGDAHQLATRGLILGNPLSRLKGGNGYKNLALDLQILSNVMRENWEKIQGKCATVADELVRADSLAASLMRVVGEREQGPGSLAAATDVRLRAFTAFIHAYQQTQRAVAYLRHGDADADSLAPSLFANKARKKAADPAPVEPVGGSTAPGVVQPAPAVGSSTAPTVTSPQAPSAQVASASAQSAKGPFLS